MTVVTLRRAALADCQLLFMWVNQPDSLEGKLLTKKKISCQEHKAWFTGCLADADCFVWIIEVDGRPAGQIRFAPRAGSHEVDIYLDAAYRGGGAAQTALKQAIDSFAVVKIGRPLRGRVKNNNVASQSLFERSGFTLVDRHSDHVVYSLQATPSYWSPNE